MKGIANALTQIEEKMKELQQVKEFLETTDAAKLVDLYHECHEKDIKLYHYFSDNRELLRNIKNYLDELVKENGFSFSMQEMHLNSEKLTIVHHKVGTIGELSLNKKRMWMWKNPFSFILRNQNDLELLKAKIPKDEERISRYEIELARYQKLSNPMKKLRGFTPSKMASMETVLKNEKENLESASNRMKLLLEEANSEWQTFVERSFEFKRFLSQMEHIGFTSDLHVFDAKKTYFMKYRKVKNSGLSGILTYEEGHISLIHHGEWSTEELNDPNLTSFRFTEEEFQHLLKAIRPHFSQAKREWVVNTDAITIETENGAFYISKEGFVIIHGEDLNLYHLLRFPSIRKALCLRYKERTHEDNLKAIQGL